MNPDTVERSPSAPVPADSEPSSLLELARNTLTDLHRILVPLILFEVVYKSAVGSLWFLGTVWLLPAIVTWAGQGAVTNVDIAAFLLTPLGLAFALIAGGATICSFLFEQVGVTLIEAISERGEAITVRRMAQTLAAASWRILRAGYVGLAALIVTFAPFTLLAAATYILILSDYDINHYLHDRPPSFYVGLGIGGLLLAGALLASFALYVRWVFVLPILILEGQPTVLALRESWRSVQGRFWRIAFILLGWQVFGIGLTASLVAAFRWLSAAALDAAGYRVSVVIPLVVFLLACHGLLLAILSFVVVAVQGLLVLRLYGERRERGKGRDCRDGGGPLPSKTEATWDSIPSANELQRPPSLQLWKLIAGAFLAFVVAGIFGSAGRTNAGGQVEITAHRGDAHRYPENTLRAVRGAIEAGADYAEIDVQEAADGAIVLMHDDDLMRVAGDSRKVRDLNLDQLRQIDVGRRLYPDQPREPIPTLEEVITLARGKIKLNIELKFQGADRDLAGAVARLIHRERFEAECLVSSLNYNGLAAVKRQNPQIQTAAIVTYALGDINRLTTDALSVNRSFLTDRLLRNARRHGKKVYVWTVNDSQGMVDLIERGVPNIITKEPRLLAEIRRERMGLTEVERRLLAIRSYLRIKKPKPPPSSSGTTLE